MAASYRCELVIDQQAPELGRRLRGGANGGDEVITERAGVGAVEGELGELGRGVEGSGGSVAGFRVRVVVCSIAEVGAAAGGGDVSWTGEYGAFVDGFGEAFDAQIDDVGAEYGHINGINTGNE